MSRCTVFGIALVACVVAQTRTGAAQVVTFIPGSTTKLEQLIGDFDKHKNTATANRTATRYRIQGTDLGNSFKHQGRLYLLFGERWARVRGCAPRPA